MTDKADSREKHLWLKQETEHTDIKIRYTTAYHLRGTFTIPKILRDNA